MISKLKSLGEEALRKISQTNQLESLEILRIQYLGKKSSLSDILKGLGSLSTAERPTIGSLANQLKQEIDQALENKKCELEKQVLEKKLKEKTIDPAIPSRLPHRGSLHVVTQTTRKLIQVFSRLGFDVMTGPEVETEFLNFEAVNIPKDHPARDMQDTFFLGPGVVLRTHTSSVQMRALRSKPWPVRMLCPGAVFRCDSDATHLPMFHQLEGLWVDNGVKMSDLKGTLEFFVKEIFDPKAQIRFRPSYFPFVEPGAEVDVSCFICNNKTGLDCKICKGSGWVEILGAGMVHPRLFELAGYPVDQVSGFAFGMGIERVAMLLYEIPDLRFMYTGDVRFLRQF